MATSIPKAALGKLRYRSPALPSKLHLVYIKARLRRLHPDAWLLVSRGGDPALEANRRSPRGSKGREGWPKPTLRHHLPRAAEQHSRRWKDSRHDDRALHYVPRLREESGLPRLNLHRRGVLEGYG